MKIVYFTSNQPRHISLANRLADYGDVFAIQEMSSATKTYKSEKMREYFGHVVEVERKVFGDPELSSKVRAVQIPMESASQRTELVPEIEGADLIVVFGSSWIRKPMSEVLARRGAINLHMGIAPFYRGAACNFWAAYDGNHDLIGGTIHYLATGLDSGRIIQHTFPADLDSGPFLRGMLGCQVTHDALIDSIGMKDIFNTGGGVRQRKDEQIRYTRAADFTDEIAAEYLRRDLSKSPRVKFHRLQIVRPYRG